MQHKTAFWASSALALTLAVGSGAQAQDYRAQGFEIESGLDVLQSPNTLIEGLHRLYIGRRVSPAFSVGQSIYSGALGDAGGAFFWGFEGVATLPVSQRLSLSLSGFVGGGGGAAQVIGDGLMLRAGVALDYQLSPSWDVQAHAAWLRIDGAPIDGPTFGLGLRYRVGAGGLGFSSGRVPEFDAISVFATQTTSPSGTRTRPGAQQPDISMVGARFHVDTGPNTQLWFGGAGAARGAQGYMQIMGGARYIQPVGGLSFFAEGSAGFAGGGLVDTGAGLLLGAALGASMPVTRTMDVELSVGATMAPDGDFSAATLTLGLMRHFNRDGMGGGAQRWAYTGGIQAQSAEAGFFITPRPGIDYVVMQHSAFDYFLGDRLYATGSAMTALQGGVAGYALGMVGLGYEMPLTSRWSISVEGLLGAAGGGGVNTAGGIVAGLQADIDYRVGESWRISAGIGRLASIESGGMQPMTLSLGVKIPFTTRR